MMQVDEMPSSGQFVAVWEHDGELWSDVLKWRDGELFSYSKTGPDGFECEEDADFYLNKGAEYLTVG